eukprot:2333520-Alexandrium_andersonii.AAC.1
MCIRDSYYAECLLSASLREVALEIKVALSKVYLKPLTPVEVQNIAGCGGCGIDAAWISKSNERIAMRA